MSTQSIIEHKANMYYVEFREDYLLLCQQCTYKKPLRDGQKCKASPYCEALILAVLESWTNDKKGKGKDLAIYMTYPQWINAMYGMFGRSTIIDSLDVLLGERLISKESHRMFGKDTYKYLLNATEVNKRIRALTERDPNVTRPQVDASISKRVESTSKRVTRPQVDAYPSTSRRNIESTNNHYLESTQNTENSGDLLSQDRHVPHPLYDFIFLNDSLTPSELIVLLTSEQYSSEIEDKRRALIAEEVKAELAKRGYTVSYRWEHEAEPTFAPDVVDVHHQGSVQSDDTPRSSGESHATQDSSVLPSLQSKNASVPSQTDNLPPATTQATLASSQREIEPSSINEAQVSELRIADTMPEVPPSRQKPERPVMPPDTMKWSAEKLVQITEARRYVRGKQGVYFDEEARGSGVKSQRQRQLDAAKAIIARKITEAQYITAYDATNNEWWNKKGSVTVELMAANTPRKIMRVVEITEELESRSETVPTSGLTSRITLNQTLVRPNKTAYTDEEMKMLRRMTPDQRKEWTTQRRLDRQAQAVGQ